MLHWVSDQHDAMHRNTLLCLLVVSTLFGTSCTTTTRTTDTQAQWQNSTLYFGLSRPGRPDVTIDEWNDFVTNQVVPAFPGGFTELIAQGHFREEGKSISEPVRILVFLNPVKDAMSTDRKLNALGRAYCARFGQHTVLRADTTKKLTFLSVD